VVLKRLADHVVEEPCGDGRAVVNGKHDVQHHGECLRST
jgi:hypothetical protein